MARKPWAPTEALLPATRVRLLLVRALDLAQNLGKESNFTQQGELLQQLDSILASPKNVNQMTPNVSVRYAFNAFTANLRFDEKYTFTGTKQEKSAYIRKYNQLPDVKQIITADLELRDLYRNEVLTNVDEARAELRYLLDEYSKSSNESVKSKVDTEELVRLLQNANASCDKWFGMIADEDVQEALDVVMTKQISNSE